MRLTQYNHVCRSCVSVKYWLMWDLAKVQRTEDFVIHQRDHTNSILSTCNKPVFGDCLRHGGLHPTSTSVGEQ